MAIYLAGVPITGLEPAAPFVRIHLWAGITEITRQDWVLSGAEGAATFHSADAAFESATAGQLHIEAVRADSSIAGTITLQFPAAGTIAGAFEAPWLPRSLMCGA